MIVPDNLKSGAYAIRLRVGPGVGIAEEYFVFLVRPRKLKAKLCFLVLTAGYLAYANESLRLGTPPHTKFIGASGGHSDNYVMVTEELLYAYAGLVGSLDYRIRGDITCYTS